MKTLVIGTGFIGSALTAALRDAGREVTQSSRSQGRADATISHGAALDRHLHDHHYDQVVVVGQLTRPDIDWVIERIDGPKWVVLSSQQVTSAVASPGRDVALAREDVALGRGACVLRPTMVFGNGRDLNISRLIRFMSRWHVAIMPGSGDQLVQPIHVDDLTDLLAHHGCSPTGGLFPAGGPEALPLRELTWTLCAVLGVRTKPHGVSSRQLSLFQRIAPLLGVRQDQWQRLTEAKTADNASTMVAFQWRPQPLGTRLEQAVLEVTQHTICSSAPAYGEMTLPAPGTHDSLRHDAPPGTVHP